MTKSPWLLVPLALACQTHHSAAPVPQASTAAVAATSPDRPAAPAGKVGASPGHVGHGTPLRAEPGHELAAFAGGCFWGVENTFRHVPGVTATAVGYTGGHSDTPTYDSVSSHTTGHAEAVLVEFDPKLVSYDELLSVFWESHDPTTKDRQGPDMGSNYRSAIFTFSPEQERVAHVSEADAQKQLKRPITTEIRAIGRFWKAEEQHQQYDERTGTESCPLPPRLRKT